MTILDLSVVALNMMYKGTNSKSIFVNFAK